MGQRKGTKKLGQRLADGWVETKPFEVETACEKRHFADEFIIRRRANSSVGKQ